MDNQHGGAAGEAVGCAAGVDRVDSMAGGGVRWAELFDDLEAQYEAAQRAEAASEISDRTRREVALLRFADRLRPAQSRSISVWVNGAGVAHGVLDAVGPDWLLIREGPAIELLIPRGAVMSVAGLTADSDTGRSEGVVASRLTLTFALRAVVRDRSPVTLRYVDGVSTTGTLDRVGHDFVEIAEHPPGEPRRRDAVRAVRTVPITAIAVIRRA